MPRILIVSKHDDRHAEAVIWGLRTLGHDPVVWHWSDFPKAGSGMLRLGAQGQCEFRVDINDESHSEPFDVVWLRERDEPAPMPGTHTDDSAIVVSESKKFLEKLLGRVGHPGTRWVNHPDARNLTWNKVTQLQIAQELGFHIPDTLVGNDVNEVRAFFDSHPGGIVYKAFSAISWDNDDGSCTVGCTSLITSAHLQHDFAIRACPAIYQEKIEKQYELRVTVMGDTVLAGAIDSQRDGPTIDWRYEGGRGNTNLRATTLQPEVADLCRVFCRRIGVAFGCIDLIVTPSGEVVFLEMNATGQFLFKEIADPDLPMLDAFCRFLVTGDAGTDGASGPTLTMTQYLAWKTQQAPRQAAAA